MICEKCGIELPEESLFCNKCGTKIVNPEVKDTNVYSNSNPAKDISINNNKSKFKIGIISVAIFIGLIIISNLVNNYTAIIFKDPNLEHFVRIQIDKPSGNIYKGDVKNIVSLDVHSIVINGKDAIKDIGGIENLTNLKELNLDFNNISDISPLKGLTKLQKLSLNRNATIQDISALRELTDLQELDLNLDGINDISALAGLTKLQKLTLVGNQIQDISALKGVHDLQILEIPGNKISDISSLKGLNNLQDLEMYKNKINDISPLKELTNLNRLLAFENPTRDISALSGLTNLKTLILDKDNIADDKRQLIKNSLPNCDISYGDPLKK